jgi:hypothetical protein
MKVIIAGSRRIGLVPARPGSDFLVQGRIDDVIQRCLFDSGFNITELVSGGAKGVDVAGEMWARSYGIPVRQFIPDWNGPYGKRAGFVRNHRMADYADALIAIWDGKSRGTAHMVRAAVEKSLKVHVHQIQP